MLSFVPGAGDTNPEASRACGGAPALSKVRPGDTFCHLTEKALPLEESCWHLLLKKKKKKKKSSFIIRKRYRVTCSDYLYH